MTRLSIFAVLAVLSSGCFLFKPASSTAPSTTSESGTAPSGDGFAPQPEFGAPASPSSDPATTASASPPGPVSVTLRNSCKETVKVFFGDKPKFGSGRYSTMSSNSSTSSSFQPGDMFWIVDDSENGISSVTVAEGMREIEIVDGCTGMRTK
jgi:hypothetical protein